MKYNMQACKPTLQGSYLYLKLFLEKSTQNILYIKYIAIVEINIWSVLVWYII